MNLNTKHSNSTLFIFLIIIGFIFTQCKEPENIYHQVSQELKDWGAFKEGTWWVYEEESLKIRDSIYIYLQETQEFRLDPENQPNHYYFNLFSHFASNRNIDSGLFDIASINSGVLIRRKTNNGFEHSLQCYAIVIPPAIGTSISSGTSGQFTIIDTIYSYLKIRDLKFSNVVRAKNNANSFYGGTPTLLYSVKNIGIVRKEFPEYDQVWNLVDYNIVQ